MVRILQSDLALREVVRASTKIEVGVGRVDERPGCGRDRRARDGSAGAERRKNVDRRPRRSGSAAAPRDVLQEAASVLPDSVRSRDIDLVSAGRACGPASMARRRLGVGDRARRSAGRVCVAGGVAWFGDSALGVCAALGSCSPWRDRDLRLAARVAAQRGARRAGSRASVGGCRRRLARGDRRASVLIGEPIDSSMLLSPWNSSSSACSASRGWRSASSPASSLYNLFRGQR